MRVCVRHERPCEQRGMCGVRGERFTRVEGICASGACGVYARPRSSPNTHATACLLLRSSRALGRSPCTASLGNVPRCKFMPQHAWVSSGLQMPCNRLAGAMSCVHSPQTHLPLLVLAGAPTEALHLPCTRLVQPEVQAVVR